MTIRTLLSALAVVWMTGCGVVYNSPNVNPLRETKVREVKITPESVLVANRSNYRPKELPAVFFQTAGVGGGVGRGTTVAPEPAFDPTSRPSEIMTRLPPNAPHMPYQIGVGDVVLLATPQVGSSVEQLTGLLAASNARQGYTVQDDGSIAIPNIGRVQVAGLTLEAAEDLLFQRMLEYQIDPTFSLEIAEFNSKKVSIGGAVSNPTVAPVTLTPLYLEEALAAAGGVTVRDQDYASIRIYRDGTLYQVPLRELYSNRSLPKIQLVDGDSVFVDTEYELDQAQAYFEQQIRLSEFRQDSRMAALNELSAEISIRRGSLAEERENYMTRLDLDAVERDYVYLTGEVETQSRFPLPFGKRATLADALFSSGGVPTQTGNVREIYVLRGSPDPREFSAVTAWRLDGGNAVNLILATRMELRPNDVIFVAEQPVTKWSRVIVQITPSLITTGLVNAVR